MLRLEEWQLEVWVVALEFSDEPLQRSVGDPKASPFGDGGSDG